MTIHSAKGLEFKNVFIVGVEENLFPGTLTALNPKELEEERRLFYVAMTRAMENLCMTHCDSRYRYGKSETASPSRFINDVAQEYIEFIGKNEDDDKDDFSNEFNRYSGRKNKEFVSKTEKLTIKTNKKLISINAASNKDHVSGCVNTDSYRPGLKVSHKSFGKGVIVSVSDEGENSKAIIDFDETGTRTLLLKFAKLDIIG
jgi:DNA helicase II / ATP-dependent DNA helicase PcrA